MTITPAIAVAITAATTAVSVASSAMQNKQQRKIADYQNAQQKQAYEKTLAVSKAQGELTANEKRRQNQNRYDAYRGALAATAAERGVGTSRSTMALQSSLGIQAARESAKISMENNINQQSMAISNMPQWQVAQSSSPFLAGIQGGLQGLSMGVGLMQGQQSLDLAQQQAALNGIQT
jgi:hypothetical protein